MTDKFSHKPRRSLDGTRWLVNRLFWDIDHWHKDSHMSFKTEADALEFIEQMRSAGHLA